ncbi:MAG: hypothetical protein ACKD6O_08050 [Candidatus Bathyarchaeota archaeon]
MSEKDKITDILNEISESKNVIQNYVNSLYADSTKGSKLAYSLIWGEDSAKLLNALCGLQQMHGLIISMHPETIYATEYLQTKPKFETIYNKIIEISEQNAKLIDITLSVYQTIKAYTPRYLASYDYCYQQLTSNIGTTGWSFTLLLLQIVSNSEKILSFLETLISGSADIKKGELSGKVIVGRTKALAPSFQPPPK